MAAFVIWLFPTLGEEVYTMGELAVLFVAVEIKWRRRAHGYPLALAGLKVAGIEARTWMSPRDYRADEIYNNVRRMVTWVPKAQREIPTVRASPSEKARRAADQHPMMNAVGGTSIHYWAQSWRLKPWDFERRSEVRDPPGNPVCRITTGGPKQNDASAVRYAHQKIE